MSALARRSVRRLQALLPPARPGGLAVLAYHTVGAGIDSPVDLPPALFLSQLDELAELAEVVPLAEGVARVAAGEDAGHRPLVALTFDDAYRNFAERAWPELARRGLPATLFVPVGFVEGEAPPPHRGLAAPPLDWATLGELAASGRCEIGSHTWSHRDLPALPAAEVDDELVRSRARLEERLGRPVDSFCYPRARRSPRVEERVRRVYRRAVVGGGGRWRGGDPLRIERVSLRRDGPPALAPLLAAPLWLEERLADRLRGWRR